MFFHLVFFYTMTLHYFYFLQQCILGNNLMNMLINFLLVKMEYMSVIYVTSAKIHL